MSVSTEAWDEALASCPPSVVSYITVEIQHPSFAEPARVVANIAEDQIFGIELSADFDPGDMVTFVACPFEAGWPEQREGEPPMTRIKIDNVNRELEPKIRAAMGYRAHLKAIYREYLSSDFTEPSYGPVEFTLRNVQMVAATLKASATVSNFLNQRFPKQSKNYSVKQFPSLLP